MTAKHSEAFIEQALVKAYSRGDQTIKPVEDGVGQRRVTDRLMPQRLR
jgi:hypothetical protein